MSYLNVQKRMLATYNSLRLGMFFIAFATPFIVVCWGKVWGIPWQNSISEYYFAPYGNQWHYEPYPGRTPFVGILFALGAFLFLYKGFSKAEDWALNCAGVFAVGVAMCPMYAETGYIPHSNVVHFTSAVLLFVCMAFTAIFCSGDTLDEISDIKLRRFYKHLYYVVGWFMGLFPLIGLALAYNFGAIERHTFWIEAVGNEAFAAYWLAKTLELRHSEYEKKELNGLLKKQISQTASPRPSL